MKRYKVTITIEAVNTLAIEANSADEAEMKAHDFDHGQGRKLKTKEDKMKKYYVFFIRTPNDDILDIWTTGRSKEEAHRELAEMKKAYNIQGSVIRCETKRYN